MRNHKHTRTMGLLSLAYTLQCTLRCVLDPKIDTCGVREKARTDCALSRYRSGAHKKNGKIDMLRRSKWLWFGLNSISHTHTHLCMRWGVVLDGLRHMRDVWLCLMRVRFGIVRNCNHWLMGGTRVTNGPDAWLGLWWGSGTHACDESVSKIKPLNWLLRRTKQTHTQRQWYVHCSHSVAQK